MPSDVKIEEYEMLTVSDPDGTVQVRFDKKAPKEALVTMQGKCKFSLVKEAVDKFIDKHADAIALG